jgi:6,7-dimethyl-8-ribityllumazine synthase
MKSGYLAPAKPAKALLVNKHVAVVLTRWNVDIVEKLLAGSLRCFEDWGVTSHSLHYVPGAYEIPLAVARLAQTRRVDAVVTLGAVIKGDTPHFDFVAGECARGLMDVQLKTLLPVGFGVLTVNTHQQALDRAADDDSNKGYEAAAAALEMLLFEHTVLLFKDTV